MQFRNDKNVDIGQVTFSTRGRIFFVSLDCCLHLMYILMPN